MTRPIYAATATERQTAIVAHDWQLFAEHPTLTVIARPYRVRETPALPSGDDSAASVADADMHPERWAMVVVRVNGGSTRMLVQRERARTLYDSLLRQYRQRWPLCTGRYELPRE